MKDGRFKNANQLIEEYISLLDEQIEIPVLLEKIREKHKDRITGHNSVPYKQKETNELYKIFSQIKKYEDRELEIKTDIAETETQLKEFLTFIEGGKIAYEKKDDITNSKITFLFWIENDQIMSNR